MLQSCETLITKINEWQKTILELEKLSDEFLNFGDNNLKPEIDKTRQKAKELAEEYQELVYPELPNGKKLFWLEKEALEQLFTMVGKNVEYFIEQDRIRVRDEYLVGLDLSSIDLSHPPLLDLSIFCNLRIFYACSSFLTKLPQLSKSVEWIWIEDNPDLKKKEKKRIKKEYPNAKIEF